jgi:hypothetical protein
MYVFMALGFELMGSTLVRQALFLLEPLHQLKIELNL